MLTDIQMPVMDGYETARGVHALDPAMPVIGITAHAMAEEKARCLAAGMLEHLAKPVDLELLVAAILRHVSPRPDGAPVPAAEGEEGGEAAPAPVDLALSTEAAAREDSGEVIDWTRLEARFNGKRDFVEKLLRTAASSQAESPAKLRAAAQAGNQGDMAFIAHALKGMGGNLMADELRELAARTEAAARAGEAQSTELAEELALAVERLLAALAARLG